MPDTIPQDPLEVPVERGEEEMPDNPVSARSQEAMEACVVGQAEGHAFCLEALRLGHQEGKMGMRESLSHRLITESGGGQARSQQPAGQGGTPT